VAKLITLTTDFGTRDSYVAQVKGVLLRLGPPDLRVIDLGHELAAQDVRAGALFLRSVLPHFAAGTIHLAVVDPGVGSARRAIVAEVAGQLLVGPDNGLFGLVLGPSARVHRIDVGGGAQRVSSTFHARDVFAPAAARLACGDPAGALGPEVIDPLVSGWPAPDVERGRVRGEIVHVDRFGNLISNIERAHLRGAARPRVVLNERVIGAIRDHYAQATAGELLALFGSDGLLEIAARDANAAALTAAGVGSALVVEL
jgi:S-adenosyl-L-methionine hydrolase (adenosine-forming)